MFITYLVLDPRVTDKEHGYKVVYVGKGKVDRPDGIKDVLTGRSKGHSGKRFNNWLKKMGRLGFKEVPIVKQPHSSEQAAFDAEKKLTIHYGLLREGGQLLNSRHGGEGGWSLSDEQRQHLSKVNTGAGNSNWGTKWTDERRAKWRATWESKDRSRSREMMEKTWAGTRRRYVITLPQSEKYVIDDLTNWCSENGHPLSAFRKALLADGFVRSKRRASRVEGWHITYVTTAPHTA